MRYRVRDVTDSKYLSSVIDEHIRGMEHYMAYAHEIEKETLLRRIKSEHLTMVEIAEILATSSIGSYVFTNKDGYKWQLFNSKFVSFEMFVKQNKVVVPSFNSSVEIDELSVFKERCVAWCRDVLFFDVKRVSNA